MANVLQQHFSQLRTREEVLEEIVRKQHLRTMYQEWSEVRQEEFLDFCTGARGVRILYDSFFKTVMDPDVAPERLEELLSLILVKEIRILKVLPKESTQITGESSLVIMDIVVELEDHQLANIEVQKMGYRFPGQRAACYSADLLLRQYMRVKKEVKEKRRKFSYRDIKKVYTIVLYEHSPKEFHDLPEQYIHRCVQKADTDLKIDLLQEYVFISLDIFCEILHNKGIKGKLEAWLAFLSEDTPEMVIKLIEDYPQFQVYYEELYRLCLDTERVMHMFSKELQELDKNTVQYMIDEMKEELESYKAERERYKAEIENYKIESENYKIESENYKIESENYRLKSETYKKETDAQKQEIERLRKLLKERENI